MTDLDTKWAEKNRLAAAQRTDLIQAKVMNKKESNLRRHKDMMALEQGLAGGLLAPINPGKKSSPKTLKKDSTPSATPLTTEAASPPRGREPSRVLAAQHHRSFSPTSRDSGATSNTPTQLRGPMGEAVSDGGGGPSVLREYAGNIQQQRRSSYDRQAMEYESILKKEKLKYRLPHEAPEALSPKKSLDGGLPPLVEEQREAYKKTLTPPPTFTESTDLLDMPMVSNAFAGALSEAESNEGYLVANAEADGAAPTSRKRNRIRVVVRKRPLQPNEEGEDCVVVTPPTMQVSAQKQRVDLSEYTESHHYAFDDAYDETHDNSYVYATCARTLIDGVFEGGSASCFAYGQTGSGKTHTMIGNGSEPGLYVLAAADIFERVQPNHRVFVSLYEIYCNSLFDLLNHRAVVVAREDANKKVNICGLTWHEISSVGDLQRLIDKGTVQRRTGSTSANEFSSRSHAVMTLTLRDEEQPRFCGSLNVVDLAGSERAADTAANDKQTRLEGAEINKSLLALKECIRGLDERKKHIPFRGSKLTEVLRDSFTGNSRTVMVATVSPSSENSEHTLNTLRYAFRVKGLSIECVEPSKERNAPRPVARAKSVEPDRAAAVGVVGSVGLPAVGAEKPEKPDRERKRKDKKKEKRKHSAAARRSDSSARKTPRSARDHLNAEILQAFQQQMSSQLEDLRAEMQRLQRQKDDKITALEEQNRLLLERMDEMRRMMTYQDATRMDDD